MITRILIAHYPDETYASEYVFASTHDTLFTNTTVQLQALLTLRPDGFLATMCSIANHYFCAVPSSLEPIQVPGIVAALPLSRRELEIAEEITKGTMPAEIAKILHLSVKTVSTYRQRIQQKLGVRTNAEIALLVRDYGRA